MAEMPGIRMSASKRSEMAKPIHRQRLETALSIKPMINQMEKMIAAQESDSESDSEDTNDQLNMSLGDNAGHGALLNQDERRSSRLRLYNFSSVGPERQWLRDALLSGTSGSDSNSDEDKSDDTPITEEYLQRMLKEHVWHKKYAAKYYRNPDNSHYMYYGSGLLSMVDRYPESNIRRSMFVGSNIASGIIHSGRASRRGRGAPRGRRPKYQHRNMAGGDDFDATDRDEMNMLRDMDDDLNDKELHPKFAAKVLRRAEQMAVRRRRVWTVMAKKETGRLQRSRAQQHRDQVQHCKRLATLCCRQARHKAMQSQKNMKETIWRCKRLTREMQAYWKRYDRAERETRRRMEREAEEQRKLDVERMEAKRQRRKLNFLITQTELYAHFMQRKLGGQEMNADNILRQLDEERDPRLTTLDHYDSEVMKQQACHNAKTAFEAERSRARRLAPYRGDGEDMEINVETAEEISAEPEINVQGDFPQPELFRGTLKGYQLKGMNWLANLYDQGISGILADEMGLGKTVQCIAFLCHVAERLGVWGPFLVVSPASTLHNWQQEMQRFAPDFKVVPYWGAPSERRILRQFWQRRDLHTPAAAFHVVVTSYQIVVSDLKYLNRVAWQHMILDEAQAIKSSASLRWKLLLGFSCRNRLLLSGTPIQNSMAELWALLHFIMPTLFDSHDEFNEWFSKDIESHAENKTAIDEKHLSRLHMILKPFMLRRIKKDVENELSDKIEIMVHCPLTIRQKLLYIALKKKIKIEDLLHYCGGGEDRNFTSNLMNLVMQFRKVCNHPELFERRDVKSPFYLNCDDYHIPRLVSDDCNLSRIIPSKRHLIYNKFSIYAKENIHNSIFHHEDNTFSFSRFINLSPSEIYGIAVFELLDSLEYLQDCHRMEDKVTHRRLWWSNDIGYSYAFHIHWKHMLMLSYRGTTFMHKKNDSQLWSDFLFVDPNWTTAGIFFSHLDHVVHKSVASNDSGDSLMQRLSEDSDKNSIDESGESMTFGDSIKLKNREVRPCQPTMLPLFLYCPIPKAISRVTALYAASRAQAYRMHIPWPSLSLIPNQPRRGWAPLTVPDKNQLVTDAGKLSVLDNLLTKLKRRGHRVLIYSQMTKMIDILEEYMWHRKHKYMRLDGSSKIAARRDMVADFQQRSDIFAFLLSTRAGGLGINLTAADTVIFYDSDWNPTVDQQAMDRAHRLGQTKQVTVYRLICKGTIEERIMQRAREKSEIQRMVISGGNFKPDTLKPKEVVSLLLDDDEIELKYRQKTEERRLLDQADKERKRKFPFIAKTATMGPELKHTRVDVSGGASSADEWSAPASPQTGAHTAGAVLHQHRLSVGNDDTSSEALVVDIDDASHQTSFMGAVSGRPPRAAGVSSASAGFGGASSGVLVRRRGAKRGRPRGSRRVPPTPTSTRQTYHSDNLSLDPSSFASMLEAASLESAAPSPQRGLARRGPGRPRLRGGAAPAPLRGTGATVRRPRRPRGPLLVPLGPQHHHHRQ